MDAVAAATGFVSLAGQILQGCQFVQTYFRDVKEAPQSIREIAAELNGFQFSLESFRKTLQDLAASDTHSPFQNPEPILHQCNYAIAKLTKFVTKYALVTAPGSGHQPSRWWSRIDFAFKKDKVKALVTALQGSKTSLLVLQANIQLALEQKHVSETRATNLALQNLKEEHTASVTLLTRIGSTVQDAALAQQQNIDISHELVGGCSTINSTTTRTEKAVGNVQLSLQSSHSAIMDMSDTMVSKLDGLPFLVSAMVESTIKRTLAQHATSDELANESVFMGASNQANSSNYERQFTSHAEASCTSEAQPSEQYDSSTSLTPFKGPKKQKRTYVEYNLWFGKISVQTVITKQSEIHTGRVISASQKRVTISPNLWFLRTSALFSSGGTSPSLGSPTLDLRFRIFNRVTRDSPIVKAIEAYDYSEVCQLLNNREATPFDVIEYPGGYERGLFDIATSGLCKCLLHGASDPLVSFQEAEALLQIAKLLADSGLDGHSAGRSVGHVLWTSRQTMKKEKGRMEDILCDFARLIMTKSETDPLRSIPRSDLWGSTAPVLRMFTIGQEEWDLEECKEYFVRRYGEGSWQASVLDCLDSEQWPFKAFSEDDLCGLWDMTPEQLDAVGVVSWEDPEGTRWIAWKDPSEFEELEEMEERGCATTSESESEEAEWTSDDDSHSEEDGYATADEA